MRDATHRSTTPSWGSVPSNMDSEGARSFLQARLRQLGKILFGLSVLFTGVYGVLALVVNPSALSEGAPMGWGARLLSSAIVLALWRVTCGRPLSMRTLLALDAGAMLALAVSFALAPPCPWMRGSPELLAQLATTHVLIARAALVPSSPRRTALIALGACLPILATALVRHWGSALDLSALARGANAMWALFSVLLATAISRVIYGLHERVREATQLGQYTLEEKLGEGGMGEVYRARHALLRRPTAVKLLPPSKAGEHNIARFEREVQLTSLLTHPNTIAIYDFGRTPDNVFYYAMEYLDGITLEELVRRAGPLPEGRVIHILSQVAGALAEAHDVGLIHRDIKPANIMISERGGIPDVVKVLDFGLVKDVSDADGSITSVQALAGTPMYMAPEALTAPDTVGPRSDLYALGAVGYFLLTGRPVFTGKSVVEIGAHHLHTSPARPSKVLGRIVAADLEDLLLACLEKDPAKRPADARTLLRMLKRCRDANAWDEEMAASFWKEHYEQRAVGRDTAPRQGVEASVEIGKTSLAIDLSARRPLIA